MEISPMMSGILALVVFVLGVLAKQFRWDLRGLRMAWGILGLSVALGVLQAVLTSQLVPLPIWNWGEPSDIVFVLLPKYLQWFVVSTVLILSLSQGVYFAIKKLLLGQA